MIDKRKYFLYVFFAFVSMFINLGTQMLSGLIIDRTGPDFFSIELIKNVSFKLLTGMITATIIAFVFKFIVDKFLIFRNTAKELKENIRQIVFYGSFAVFTTLIFWGFEVFFKYVFVFSFSEYIGGFVGLMAGYSIKFILDSKFVFNRE